MSQCVYVGLAIAHMACVATTGTILYHVMTKWDTIIASTNRMLRKRHSKKKIKRLQTEHPSYRLIVNMFLVL